ncbi:MAG: hypothetical protein WA903_00425 [Ornithinimicrobium sp.]
MEILRGAVEDVQASARELGSDELIRDDRALQSVISAASAVQSVRLAQFAARDEIRNEDGEFVEVDLGLDSEPSSRCGGATCRESVSVSRT